MIIYSHLPRQAYSVEHEGFRWGVGLHRVFDVVEGAWNLMYLVAGVTLDSLLTYNGSPENYPTHISCLPICVATALQQTGNGPVEIWDDLLRTLPPAEVITRFETAPVMPLLFRQYGPGILDLLYKNAASFTPAASNVVRVNFQTKQLIH